MVEKVGGVWTAARLLSGRFRVPLADKFLDVRFNLSLHPRDATLAKFHSTREPSSIFEALNVRA